MHRSALAATLALSFTACGGDDSSGADASIDQSADESTSDAADASTDATPPSDASVDTSPPSDGAPDAASDADSGLVVGAPISAPANTWTWVDFPTSACDDGTPTGIGVNPSATSTNVLVYFEGGGACWDYNTCVTLNTSAHGPFGMTQFQAVVAGVGGTVVDRATAQSPFKDWNLVFVPYCTGDLHAGSADPTYTNGTASKTIHHRGHTNALAFLSRLAATFRTPAKIAVAGSSAGGGGAVFNYPAFRAYWPTTSMYLVDDSLPLFVGDSIPPAVRDPWFASWNLGAITDPLCGAPCRSDLSLAMKALATRYASDRMALLTSQQDQTIRSYYQLGAAAFQMALATLTTSVLDPLGHFKHFYVNGATHTMLGSPASYTSGTAPLWTWLTQMVTDDVAWASTP